MLAAGGGGDEDEDGGAEGLDEFIVPPTLLDSITSQLGWRKLCCENFHEFFTRMASSSNHAALKRLLDWRGSFSDDEWEVAGVSHCVCVCVAMPACACLSI